MPHRSCRWRRWRSSSWCHSKCRWGGIVCRDHEGACDVGGSASPVERGLRERRRCGEREDEYKGREACAEGGAGGHDGVGGVKEVNFCDYFGTNIVARGKTASFLMRKLFQNCAGRIWESAEGGRQKSYQRPFVIILLPWAGSAAVPAVMSGLHRRDACAP